ncbi:hypothetical protein [Celerinatantimonas sp. MCCC 1A17872]|uniref:hypothetical protein n=1 Tax=Celerinatantimonas sp. MCCC 1A17872 TaxID=3177514 RepID=UPI0038CB326A
MSFPLQAMPSIHDGLDALWHHHYQKAEQVFQKLGEQGNAHAMYWLGNTYQLEGGMKRLDAGRILLKAAKMGDPWAMDRLDPDNAFPFCSFWPCDSKWKGKALESWEKLSKKGNGKATFALLLHKEDSYWYRLTKWLPSMGQEKLNKMAIKSFNQGYQGSAVYLFKNDKSKKLKYITQSANNGFVPAYSLLSTYYESKKNVKLMNKYKKLAVQSGDRDFIKYLFVSYIRGWGEYDKNIDKAYYYGSIISLYGEDLSIFFNKNGSQKYRLNTKISSAKKNLLYKKAKEFFITHPPYYYYDEFHQPFGLMNF